MKKINWGTVLSIVSFAIGLAANYFQSKDLDEQIDARIESKIKDTQEK